ncbi:DUF6940 family protein [Gracilimonas sp.]|uniref:DUF6940 family protein n=1 Tax=Gracilimonas sp. TaxID=1974203 RepID=UPI00287278DB|nr:hypothetical protein [Gracilimonas sp.]
MWTIQKISSSSNHFRFKVFEEKSTISHKKFLSLLRDNDNFVEFYNKQLVECTFDAFFWENKPFTEQHLKEPYECNLVKSDHLSTVQPDSNTFNSYFKSDKEVVTFPNLGGDAKLVVPCPFSDHSTYTQIGNFVREAPESQIQEFWKMVGQEMVKEIGSEPKWLSTSGLGVFWLHARIDSTPKYYQTQEYKTVG